MPKCQECGKKFGLFELKSGICKTCINEKTPPCIGCRNNFEPLDLIDGYCETCYQKEQYRREQRKKARHIEEQEKVNASVGVELNIPFISSSTFVATKITKTVGMARGSTVRAKHIGRDFMADLKNLIGGELKGYTELLAEGREEAIYRMKQDAVRLGANAIVSVRLTTSTITTGATEMLAYGTAVVIEEE